MSGICQVSSLPQNVLQKKKKKPKKTWGISAAWRWAVSPWWATRELPGGPASAVPSQSLPCRSGGNCWASRTIRWEKDRQCSHLSQRLHYTGKQGEAPRHRDHELRAEIHKTFSPCSQTSDKFPWKLKGQGHNAYGKMLPEQSSAVDRQQLWRNFNSWEQVMALGFQSAE